MKDTIYRQDAIDALEEPCKMSDAWTDEYAVGERMQWEKDVKALNGLPSAEPEIVRCKDCKHSERWYRDKLRCFLWYEDGIGVFEDGFCNYAERGTDE